ncbi:MAG TPA: hypothetical protein VFM94_00200 [Solirubrobacterales bacterium]|nr:hypothetical protein [Solirubrobacterales bacterium]
MNGAATPPPDWSAVLNRAHRMVTQRLMNMAAIGALGAVLLLAGGLIGRAAVADEDPATGGRGDTPAKQEGSGEEGGTDGESQAGTEGSESGSGSEEGEGESKETEESEEPEAPTELETPDETEEPETPEPEVAEPPAEEAPPPAEEEFRAPR